MMWYNIGCGATLARPTWAAIMIQTYADSVGWSISIQPNRFSTVMPRNAMMIQHWRRGHNDDTTCQQKNSSLQQQNLFPLIVTPQLRNDFVIVYAGSVERGRSPIQAIVLPPFCGDSNLLVLLANKTWTAMMIQHWRRRGATMMIQHANRKILPSNSNNLIP